MKGFMKSIPATAVLSTHNLSTIHVSRIVTFPNVIDVLVENDRYPEDLSVCAHLSLEQTRDLIAALTEALKVELTP